MHKIGKRFVIATFASMLSNVVIAFLTAFLQDVGIIPHGLDEFLGIFFVIVWPVINLILAIIALICTIKGRMSGETTSVTFIILAALEVIAMLFSGAIMALLYAIGSVY